MINCDDRHLKLYLETSIEASIVKKWHLEEPKKIFLSCGLTFISVFVLTAAKQPPLFLLLVLFSA